MNTKNKTTLPMQIKFKKLHPKAVAPTKAHTTDAGFDLTATSCQLDDNGAFAYGTGIAVEIPYGHVGLVFPRSSVVRTDLALTNAVGVIDSGYRGEIMLKFKVAESFTDDNAGQRIYNVGDRIGQLIIIPIPDIQFTQTEQLSDSDRGTGGYGSSGK